LAPNAPGYVVSAFGVCACIRTAEWSYTQPWLQCDYLNTMDGKPTQLYDLKADPKELTDVRKDHPEVIAQLRKRLEEHIRKYAPLTTGSCQSKGDVSASLTFDALPAVDNYV